jgi:CRISPR-associated RAMP protein (TIGR02581 family)
MLKRKLCEAVISWDLTCKGPFLIKDGRFDSLAKANGYSKEKGYPDSLFISRLSDTEFRQVVKGCHLSPPKTPFYVPGTSLRGPVRALAERIIRSLVMNPTSPVTACDPFEQDPDADLCGCSKRQERQGDAKIKYASSCPACKIFGCAGLASRLQITDADIKPLTGHSTYDSLYRDMVGIDRFTGGASGGALMRFHVLENTCFTTIVTVTNFELWQLGLLAYVFRDFEEGLAPIGFGKTKGFGQVRGEVTGITLAYPKALAAPVHLEHLGSLATDEEFTGYKLYPRQAPVFESLSPKDNGLSVYHSYTVTAIDQFWATAAPYFNAYIDRLNQEEETT